jgi:hypothetical protein
MQQKCNGNQDVSSIEVVFPGSINI